MIHQTVRGEKRIIGREEKKTQRQFQGWLNLNARLMVPERHFTIFQIYLLHFDFYIMSEMAISISRLRLHRLENPVGRERFSSDTFGKSHNSGSPVLVPHFKPVPVVRGA